MQVEGDATSSRCRRRRRAASRASSRACCSPAIGRSRSPSSSGSSGERDGGEAHRRARGAARAPRGERHPGGRRSRAAGTCGPTRRTSPGCRASWRGQAAAPVARDAGDAGHRRLPPADHAARDRRDPRRRLRPGLEDAARSRPRADDRQEGGGRAADPLRDDAGVPAHLQPARSHRAADAARVPRARRGADEMAKVDARGRRRAAATPRRGRRRRSRRRRSPRARSRGGRRAAGASSIGPPRRRPQAAEVVPTPSRRRSSPTSRRNASD